MPEDIQNLTLLGGRSRQPAAEVPSILSSMLPIIGVVLVAYLVIGLAMPALPLHVHVGAFTAFLDLSLGLTGPALGLVASGAGLGAVFLVSTLVVMCSAAIAVRLIKRRWVPDDAVLLSNLEV